jgi:beta-N-acetylhexosaminidase
MLCADRVTAEHGDRHPTGRAPPLALPAVPRLPGPLRTATLVLACAVAAACTGTTAGQVEVATVEETSTTTSTTTPPDCAETLPPAAQAGQLLMVMVTSPQLATDAIAAGRVGGFGLKGRQSADVGDEVAAAVADAPVVPFVASDEEGGTVQRLGRALGPLDAAATFAQGTPQEAAIEFGAYARSMAELGFNMNFGPVADVGSGSDLGTRSFGDDPSTVSRFVEAIVNAQEEAGIASVVKHWPGIGGGATDPHLALDELAPLGELRSRDLVPFERAFAAGASAVMVAHAVVPGLTDEGEPASLSRAAITDELRGRQGFDGLVVTDSLGMGAVVNTYDQEEAAELAIAAGADVALLSGPDLVDGAHERLTEAISSGRLPAEQVAASVRRVLAAKGISGPCMDLVAVFSALGADAADADADAGDAGGGSSAGTSDTGDTTGGGTTGGGGTGGVADRGINDTSGSG